MTPHELKLYADAHNERRENEYKERVHLAYLISAWHPYRTKRLPKLTEVLKTKPKEQTDEQMFAIVKAMHAAMTREERN